MYRENAIRSLKLGEQLVDAVGAGKHDPLVPTERGQLTGLHLDRLDGDDRAGHGGGPLRFQSPCEIGRLLVRARHHDAQSGERAGRGALPQEPGRAAGLEPRRDLMDHLGIVEPTRSGAQHPPSPIAKDDGVQDKLVAGDDGVGPHSRQATASEAAQQQALRPDGTAGVAVVDAGRQLGRLGAVDGLDGQRPLAGCRQHNLKRQQLMGLAQPAEALESGRCQDQPLHGPLGETAEPGVDVAADLDRAQVWPDGRDLGGPAWTTGAEPRSGRQLGEGRRWPGDQRVTGVGPFEEAGHHQSGGWQRGKVLRRMNGQIGPPVEQRLLEFLDEHSLARRVGQAQGRVPVAMGGQRHEDELVLRISASQGFGRKPRLDHGERATSGRQPKGGHWVRAG